MPEFQPPKGMKDIMPEEMAKRKEIYAKIRSVLDRWNYTEVEPPALEDLKTLTAKSGEDVKNEIYILKDKGGRELGLRFDLTVGLARMAATAPVTFPFKAYAISNMWRYDNPQFGRFRSFWQWDVEIFGAKGIKADAETIALAVEILNALGLKNFEVRINDRRLVECIIKSCGVKEENVEGALRTIDKIAKLQKHALLSEFEKYGIKKADAEKILSSLSMRGKIADVTAKLEKSKEFGGLEQIIGEFKTLGELLRAFGVYDKCVLDLSVVRGLGYYTGIVYEAADLKTPELGSLFGGGRYDNLAGIYGRKMPACGVAGGIERTLAAMEAAGLFGGKKNGAEYFVAAVNDSMRADTIKIAANLRKSGISAEIDIMNKSLREQFDFANKTGAKKIIIVGPKELAEGAVIVRNMKTGKEGKVRVSELTS
ncbi:histidine--tRNA ligase [archaeon]|nr:histidine--tRNA ligase [Nanoarchaeota archaeon]MBU4451894.1 histidine--tRNA ligase [Nanoarchaeota archaeon]MCG2724178.1 histidine--tRNA ligase [archaeon]